VFCLLLTAAINILSKLVMVSITYLSFQVKTVIWLAIYLLFGIS